MNPVPYQGPLAPKDIFIIGGKPTSPFFHAQNEAELLKIIGDTLTDAANPTPLTGSDIRFLRNHMDATLDQLAAVLGVSPHTVRQWEDNRTPISKPAEALLRIYYRSWLNVAPEKPLDFLNRHTSHCVAAPGKTRASYYFIYDETGSFWRKTTQTSQQLELAS